MKIKVNGIRVNKTTGCLGNSVPCPTHSSLAFTFVQSPESNNTLLTEGHNRQQCSIFKLYLNKRGFAVRRIHTASERERSTQRERERERRTERDWQRERIQKRTPFTLP